MVNFGYITRRFKFSASHRYWVESWSEQKNKAVFGSRISKYGFGHNYILDVTVKGEINKTTGMVINLVELKKIGDTVVDKFDHKFLNMELDYFQQLQPTAENLAKLFWELIECKLPNGIFLHRIRLYPSDDVFAEYHGEEGGNLIGKTFYFSATHRLYADKLTNDENINLYDKCYSKFGHGHNYKLTVYYKDFVDKLTGMIVPLKDFDNKVSLFIEKQLHGKRLDVEIDALKNNSSTSENLTNYVFNELKSILGNAVCKIKLKETDNNFFEKGD